MRSEESASWLHADLARHLATLLAPEHRTQRCRGWSRRSTGSPPSPSSGASRSGPSTTARPVDG